MKQKFNAFVRLYKITHVFKIIASVLDTGAAIYLGYITEELFQDIPTSKDTWGLFIVLITVVVLIKLFGVLYDSFLPLTLATDLKNGEELIEVKLKCDNQSQSTQYILSALNNLNDVTCQYLTPEQPNNKFCDDGIAAGLKHLLSGFLHNIPTIMGTPITKYLVGVQLESYYDKYGNVRKSVIVLENNRLTENDGSFMMILTNSQSGLYFDVKTEIARCFESNQSHRNHTISEPGYSILTTPIPDACYQCNDCQKAGVLFIITESNLDFNQLPGNLSVTLDIFTKIIGNWVVRYNNCIEERKKMALLPKKLTQEKTVHNFNNANFDKAESPFLAPTPTPIPVVVPNITPCSIPQPKE